MLKRLDISDINLEDGYFHFTKKENLDKIEKYNLLPKIGKNSAMIENSEKIFFSVGASNILKTHDVWLKWLMNRMYGAYGLAKKYDDLEFARELEAWKEEFLSKSYKYDKAKKNALFTKYYNEMIDNVYLKLLLTSGRDFDLNDYDDVKMRLKQNKDSLDYLFMKERYGKYSNISSNKMDMWNMHTIRDRWVKSKDVCVVVNNEIYVTVIDMLKLIYSKYKGAEYDLLDDFMIWLEKYKN